MDGGSDDCALAGASCSKLGRRPRGNETWSELRQEGLSIVFGRIQGRFDGTDYRGRKIRVRHIETGDEHLIRADEALGFFEATLPVGSYEVVAIGAVYFPSIRPMNPRRFPPVKQRYRVKAPPNVGIPTFPVLPEAPIYLGTIRSGVRSEGLVYKGHALEIIDEFPDALERLANRHPRLMESVQKSGAEPKRYFFLEPKLEESPLEIAALHSPLNQARDYISDRRFDQALSWLATFLPTTDDERIEVQLLVGEALLADKQYIEAIEELGEVLLVEPGRERALRLLARTHAYEGHREDAMRLYRALAEAGPRDAEASLQIGFEYALASEEKLAEAAFTSAFSENFDYLLHDLTPYALRSRKRASTMCLQKSSTARRASSNRTISPTYRLCFWVRFFVDVQKPLCRQRCIFLRRRQAFMAEELLDRA